MNNQTLAVCHPSHELAIIPYNSSHELAIIPYNQNINNQSLKPDNTTRISPFFRKICSSLMKEFQRHYTTEQLLTIAFLQIMTAISVSHLVLGFELMEKSGLSKSISPISMSIFKYSLAIFAGFSIARVDLHRHLFKDSIRKTTYLIGMYVVLPLAHFLSPHFLSPSRENYRRIFLYMIGNSCMPCFVFLSTGPGRNGCHVKFGIFLFMRTIVFPIVVRKHVFKFLIVISIFSNIYWVAISYNLDLDLITSSAPSLLCFLDKSVQKLLPLATARVKSALKKKKLWKLVKYAIGLVGTLIFQNFFRLTTFVHVKVFMYLATSWLANLALINATDDFGILNFLLGNMILGSTVSQYGLEITTWFTYGVCLFLYILGKELKSNTSQNIENLPRPTFLFWFFYCCVFFDSLYHLFHQSK